MEDYDQNMMEDESNSNAQFGNDNYQNFNRMNLARP